PRAGQDLAVAIDVFRQLVVGGPAKIRKDGADRRILRALERYAEQLPVAVFGHAIDGAAPDVEVYQSRIPFNRQARDRADDRLDPLPHPGRDDVRCKVEHLPEALRGRRSPGVAHPGSGLPDLRPLRRVLVPRPRLVIPETLVEHHVELSEELDRRLVGVAVIAEEVVAWPVPPRTPDHLVLGGCAEGVEGLLHVAHVAHLVCDVVDAPRSVGPEQVDRVVVGGAAEEDEEVADRVRPAEPEHFPVEVDGPADVAHEVAEVAELLWAPGGGALAPVLDLRIEVEWVALRIANSQQGPDPRFWISPPLGCDPALREVGFGILDGPGDLEGEVNRLGRRRAHD